MDLTTTYLGLNLKNPIVPSAGPLSTNIDNIKAMEDAGAGAVVNKVVTAHPIASTATLLAAPVVANVLTSSPKTASVVGNAILTTPTALQNYGSNIGKAIENPSIANIMDIAKENPILTAATAAGAAYLGSGLVSTAVTALNTRAANANTKSVIENTNSSSVIDNATSSLPISSNMKMIMPVQSPDENIVMPSITKASNPAPSTKNKKKKVTTKKKKTKKKALKKKNTSKKKVTSKKKKKR